LLLLKFIEYFSCAYSMTNKWVIIHWGWWILSLALGLMSHFLNIGAYYSFFSIGVYESFVKDQKTTLCMLCTISLGCLTIIVHILILHLFMSWMFVDMLLIRIPLSSQKVVIYVFIICYVFKAKRQKTKQIKRSYMSFLCHFFVNV
jgi:hypothetical protein